MSARSANEIRPADMPMYCSACFGQNLELQHVDFDAACDRGYGYGDVKVSMDDLILCENCVREGARLIGMVDATDLQDRLASLERRLKDERLRADKASDYSARMEAALAERPTPVKVSRPRGRPRKQRTPMTTGVSK